jgi:hypothetical protein
LNAGDAVVLQRIVNGLITPTFFNNCRAILHRWVP